MFSENGTDDFILRALDELGGAQRFLPGAQLAAATRKIAEREGFDFAGYLRSTGIKFGDLVRSLVDRNQKLRLEVHEGSDFLIGYVGAETRPITSKLRFIRKDFYDAFTLFNRAPLYYDASRDEILKANAENSFAIPMPTQDREFKARIEFAEKSSETDALQLRSALNAPNALSAFSLTISRAGLVRSWHEFNYERLSNIISEWATENHLLIKKEWFDHSEPSLKSKRSASSLREIFNYLNDDELATIFVPASLIAEILKRISER